MKLSVIIPTYHRNDLLALCLDRLAPGAQSIPFDQYEVIVSDDGSQTTAEELIRNRYSWARWVKGPRRGPAANRNNGARQAAGEWLVFSDDDCLPDPGLLRAYADGIFVTPQSNVFEGRISADGPKRHPLEDAPINEDGGHLWSCNFAIRRETFQRIDGFDERFPYAAMEDMDLHFRLRRAGESPVFLAGARVIHPWKRVDLVRHWRRHLKSQMIYHRLHPEESWRFSVWGYWRGVVRFYLRTFPADIRRFGWKAIRVEPLRWWGILLHSWVLVMKPDPSTMSA